MHRQTGGLRGEDVQTSEQSVCKYPTLSVEGDTERIKVQYRENKRRGKPPATTRFTSGHCTSYAHQKALGTSSVATSRGRYRGSHPELGQPPGEMAQLQGSLVQTGEGVLGEMTGLGSSTVTAGVVWAAAGVAKSRRGKWGGLPHHCFFFFF